MMKLEPRAARRRAAVFVIFAAALIVAGTAVYYASNRALDAKMLPIALNVVALVTLILGIRWPVVASRERPAVSSLSS